MILVYIAEFPTQTVNPVQIIELELIRRGGRDLVSAETQVNRRRFIVALNLEDKKAIVAEVNETAAQRFVSGDCRRSWR